MLIGMLLAGALVIQLRPSHEGLDNSALAYADGRDVLITGHVVKEGNPREKSPSEMQQRIDLELEKIEVGNSRIDTHSRIRLTVYGKAARGDSGDESAEPMPQFLYGERLCLPTKLSEPRNFRNPGSFDYRGFLADQGVVAIASAKVNEIEILPGFVGNKVERWRNQFHRKLSERIRQLWPDEQAAVLDALLIGENEFVGRRLLTDYQKTGTYHVLVISGLKVGILAAFVFWLLRRVQTPEFVASAVTILLVVAYAWLTDVGVPVWRATLMLIIYFAARFLYRDRSSLNTIGAAGILFLSMLPADLATASFQLSFLCVLVIVGIGTPLLDRTTRPLRSALRNIDATSYDFVLPPRLVQFRLDLRLVINRCERLVGRKFPRLLFCSGGRWSLLGCEFLIVSLVIQVGFIMPMAYYFHRATLVSLPANILAVPLTQIAMIAAMVAISASYISARLALLPAAVAGYATQAMSGSVRWIGAFQVADMRVPTPTFVVIVLSLVALAVGMVLVRQSAKLAVIGISLFLLSGSWIFVPPHPQFYPGVLEVTAIDVGLGDSILVVSPEGKTLLLDAGGIPHWMHSELDIGEDVVSPYLWARGFSHLDAVAVSHPHADHIGGMSAILANFHPKEIWLGDGSPNPELTKLLQEGTELHIHVRIRNAGDGFEASGLRFHVFAPERAAVTQTRRENDDSLVMSVQYGSTTVLLEGDAEKEAEHRIASESPSADLLKVAHHGSATSTIPELLAAVHPRFAVISVGMRNVYGHPRLEVLQRLADSNVRTYRTDLDGATTFYLDGKTVTPATDLR
jgi:competence protein ComEC